MFRAEHWGYWNFLDDIDKAWNDMLYATRLLALTCHEKGVRTEWH